MYVFWFLKSSNLTKVQLPLIFLLEPWEFIQLPKMITGEKRLYNLLRGAE